MASGTHFNSYVSDGLESYTKNAIHVEKRSNLPVVVIGGVLNQIASHPVSHNAIRDRRGVVAHTFTVFVHIALFISKRQPDCIRELSMSEAHT